MSKSIGLYCPHCEERLIVSSRKKPSRLYHKLIVICRNPDCLASYAASIELDRVIHDSLSPSQNVTFGIHDWQRNMEHQLASLEMQAEIGMEQKTYVEGLINALFWARKIDLNQAQVYRNRLTQMRLL